MNWPLSEHRVCVLLVLMSSFFTAIVCAQSLEAEWRREGAETLALAAKGRGNAARGAYVFYRPGLACAKCHEAPEGQKPIGPVLSDRNTELTPAKIVEAILEPSKTIRKEYEPVLVETKDGRVLHGFLEEKRDDRLVLRDAAQDGKRVEIMANDVESQLTSDLSLMPAGLANQFQGKQDLLDLVAYVREISEKGPTRARELRPSPAALAASTTPAYERDIDHAGMIASLDQKAFDRGEEIYSRTCVNCHGTIETPGSLPTSLRFAEGKFKNGADPYAMYRTLTDGFGMMTPQTWMVPTQKYDVIHYVREAYLKPRNPSQYKPIDDTYLAGLPKGSSRGPAPSKFEPWSIADYGPMLTGTYELPIVPSVSSKSPNPGPKATPSSDRCFAYKGIAVRVDPGLGGVAQGRTWMVFDHDTLRMVGGWTGMGFVDWNGILFNGRHNVHPLTVGQVGFANPNAPGWANPADGSFRDVRLRGRDGIAYGPMPREWGRFLGFYAHGDRRILSYRIGTTDVLEMPGASDGDDNSPTYIRTIWLGPRERELVLQVAHHDGANAAVETMTEGNDSVEIAKIGNVLVDVWPRVSKQSWRTDARGDLRLAIPAGREPQQFDLRIREGSTMPPPPKDARAVELPSLTQGGPTRWPEVLPTNIVQETSDGPFVTDVLTHPIDNPWKCQMRFTGFDFFNDGDRAAICGWDGDVWIVSGLTEKGATAGELTWRRIAAGLFQPLGLKIVNDVVYVACRDQIVILRDKDGDGETDFYECFNNDHQVTEHFHEFAMGLQRDAEGNFYYAKSARHALPALVPHHGTLLRVGADGASTEILATGFRAANGVCLNPDGTYFVTDQEGHWMPKNRINWVRPGRFYGNMLGYHDVKDSSDAAMEPPVCWITNAFDRSPAECLWVPPQTWGPLAGRLLDLSYGYGKVFVVLLEAMGDQMQGGLCELPIREFPTGIIRGRFHPKTGDLYVCGMYSWAGSRLQPGGFYRVRWTGKPLGLPIDMAVERQGMRLVFAEPLDPASVSATSFVVSTWSLQRTENYGSPHLDEKKLEVKGAMLDADLVSLHLEIPDLRPTMGMEIKFDVRSSTGLPVRGVIHNSIHQMPD
jgi:putative heme-binding domain-containing protein